jgi:hypothetical protein
MSNALRELEIWNDALTAVSGFELPLALCAINGCDSSPTRR